MFKASSGNSDGLWVAPKGSRYRAYMSVSFQVKISNARDLTRPAAYGNRELGVTGIIDNYPRQRRHYRKPTPRRLHA